MNPASASLQATRLFLSLCLLFTLLPLTHADRIGEALGQPDRTWTLSGDAAWFVETSVTHDGVSALRSGAITHRQSSKISTTVEGPLQVSFWWKASSEARYDGINFSADQYGAASANTYFLAGEAGWQQVTVTLGGGPYTLTWSYNKDRSGTGGQDAGWLDEVNFTPLPPAAPAIKAAPYPQVIVSGDTFRLSTQVTGAPLAYQWLRNGKPVPGATNWSYIVTNAQPELSGSYQLVASNSLGVATSPASYSFVAPAFAFRPIASYTFTNETIREVRFIEVPPSSPASATPTGSKSPRPADLPLNPSGEKRIAVATDKSISIFDEKMTLISSVSVTSDRFTSIGSVYFISYSSDPAHKFLIKDPYSDMEPIERSVTGTIVGLDHLHKEADDPFSPKGDWLIVRTVNPAALLVYEYSTQKWESGGISRTPTSIFNEPPISDAKIVSMAVSGTDIYLGTDTGAVHRLSLDPLRQQISYVEKFTEDPSSPKGAALLSATETPAGTKVVTRGAGTFAQTYAQRPGDNKFGPFSGSRNGKEITDIHNVGRAMAYGYPNGQVEVLNNGAAEQPGLAPTILTVGGCQMQPPPSGPTFTDFFEGIDRTRALIACQNTVTLYALIANGNPPTFSQQPAVQPLTGGYVNITAAATGDGPISFKLIRTDDPQNPGGETFVTAQLPPLQAQLTQSSLNNYLAPGNYLFRVRNPWGEIISKPFSLYDPDKQPPVIKQQPQDTLFQITAASTFSVTAQGTPTLTYQWFEVFHNLLGDEKAVAVDPNDTGYRGATAETMVILGASSQPWDIREFFVRVTNPYGSVDSNHVKLTGLGKPMKIVGKLQGSLNHTLTIMFPKDPHAVVQATSDLSSAFKKADYTLVPTGDEVQAVITLPENAPTFFIRIVQDYP